MDCCAIFGVYDGYSGSFYPFVLTPHHLSFFAEDFCMAAGICKGTKAARKKSDRLNLERKLIGQEIQEV